MKETENLTNENANVSTLFDTLSDAQKSKVRAEIERLKKEHEVPFIHVFVGKNTVDVKKPYILYFKPPTKLAEMSIFYYDAQSDPIVGNQKLAKKLCVGGDREVVDSEFLYMHTGLMSFIPQLLPQADGELKTF